MDLPIIINDKLAIPLRQQLVGAFKELVNSGKLLAGQAVPSVRQLARSLGVSQNTIVHSYKELIGQGFLEAKPGCGTYVSYNPPRESSPREKQRTNKIDTEELSSFAVRLLQTELSDGCADKLPQLNYGAGALDLLPIRQWRKILVKHTLTIDPSKLGHFTEPFGYRPLCEEIVRYLRRSKGINCEVDQLMVFPEAQTILHLIAMVLIKPGDTVVLETPGYSIAREVFFSHGAKVHVIPIDRDGLMVDKLRDIKERCKLIYVTPSHHDPTGMIMSLARRKDLLSWANHNCEFIVEEAWDSDYNHVTPPLPALQGLDQNGKVLYIYSFYKALYPLLMTGCLVVPSSLIDIFTLVKQSMQRVLSMIESYTLMDFIKDGHLDRHLHKSGAIYKKRRQALIFELTKAFQTKIYFYPDSPGLHISVRLNLPISGEKILTCARKVGLPMVSTSGYYMNDPQKKEYLISFAIIPEAVTAELVDSFVQEIKRATVTG